MRGFYFFYTYIPSGVTVKSQSCRNLGSVETPCGLYCVRSQLQMIKRYVPTLFLPLACYLLFSLLSFYHVLLSHKSTKKPGTGKNSLPVLCSGVASNILRSNRHCHKRLVFDIQGSGEACCIAFWTNITAYNTLCPRFLLNVKGLLLCSSTVPDYFESYFCYTISNGNPLTPVTVKVTIQNQICLSPHSFATDPVKSQSCRNLFYL